MLVTYALQYNESTGKNETTLKFVDAVLALCDERPGYIPPPPQPKKRPEFVLPPAAVNNRRVFAYLLKRGMGSDRVRFALEAQLETAE